MRQRAALILVAGWGLVPLLALRAEDQPPAKPEQQSAKFLVPYRLTDTNHLMVRVKINGKGPFNMVVDTGAPAVFITKAVAQKARAKPDERTAQIREHAARDARAADADDKGWFDFDSFELEGGLKVEKVRGRVEDLVQFEGMNSMGLAGVEVHGVIGYNVLARYRIEYDLTSDKLGFEPLAYDPAPLVPLGGGKGGTDIQALGPLVKLLAALSGIKPNFDTAPRGFTGIEYEEKDGKLFVKSVLPDSPAEKAGLKSGDQITRVKSVKVKSGTDLQTALAKAGVGTKWRFFVTRGDKDEEIVVELGKGL
jgi:serine protease DegQ